MAVTRANLRPSSSWTVKVVTLVLLVTWLSLVENRWIRSFSTRNFSDWATASFTTSSASTSNPHWTFSPPSSRSYELSELVGSSEDANPSSTECPASTIRYNDTVTPDDVVWANDRRIPRIIHFTSRSRCLAPQFVENLQKWHFPNHSVYLHDDAAVDRLLLERHWPQFPHLHATASCLLSGAAKADLWRAVVLYEYGGIYSDIDNSPNQFGPDTIQPDDEAFFVVEQLGIMSQWFMAARPRHPFLYMLVHMTLQRLYEVTEVDKQYVPFVTGPGAVKNAMIQFMNAVHVVRNVTAQPSGFEQFQRVLAGTYTGLDNATIRVVGRKGRQSQYVCRNCVNNKQGGYAEMGMRHFSKVRPPSNQESCLNRIYRQHEKDRVERRTI